MADTPDKVKKQNGGARPRSGVPVGYVHQKTRDKLAQREALRRIVDKHMERLVQAQIENARGLSHLFIRDKAGQFVQITDEKQIEAVLNSGEQDKYFYIHTKDPSISAFSDLMNRSMDKPKDQEQEIVMRVDDGVVARLMAARKRAKP